MLLRCLPVESILPESLGNRRRFTADQLSCRWGLSLKRLFISSAHASVRLFRARQWLQSRVPAEEVLVVGATVDAGNELLRSVASEIGAAFGWRRTTLGRFAGDLARPILVEKSLAPIGTLGVEALIVRSLHELGAARKLGQYAGVAFTPGFARAAAKTIQELRLARAEPSNLASAPAELVQILQTLRDPTQ